MSLKKKKNIKLSVDELNALSREELITRIIQFQEHNIQLKNLLAKLQNESETSANDKNNKAFDFAKWQTIHIMLRFLYLGWDFQGYASVEDTVQTVEHRVLEALKKCRLIESRETCNYHRCGRTDKGVSAFSQVISLTVRSKACSSDGVEDLDYCGMLNRLLPQDIRITGWCQVPPDTSARFNCTSRTYRYYFPKAQLDVQAMNEAAQHLKGTHDFRNICKMDVANGVTNFIREITEADILQLPNSEDNGYSMYEVRLIGRGFLWHQVRCIMAVLIMVGQHHEQPDIITQLLNIEQCPKKPQYNLSHEVGLCLFWTKFDVLTPWCVGQSQLSSVVSHLQGLWAIHAIRAAQVREMLRELESQMNHPPLYHQAEILLGKQCHIHKPLLTRNTCNSLEERLEHYRKRFKSDKGSIEMNSNSCSKEEVEQNLC